MEEQEQMSIADIFEQKGEAYFRKIEGDVLRNYKDHSDCIVSTGGGAPCFFGNMQWMNDHGHTIYLKASPKELADRLKVEKAKRPLIKNIPDDELENFIKMKLSERESFYKQAQLVLNPNELNPQTLSALQL